ncbi:MAG: hypothetical protein N3C60_08840 [Calditerrivibrio sp.]|nr:hypothetical protein [Calditerrivibrio sp.]
MRKSIFSLMFLVFISGIAIASNIDVKITPPSGPALTQISIDGTGFKSGEEIDIILTLSAGEKIGLGTEKVDVITADDKGNISVKTSIPMMAKPGTYKLEIIGNQGSYKEMSLIVTDKK